MRLTTAFGLPFTQPQVDFVIPDLEIDLPLAIDPFLLFKSRDPDLRELHARLLSIFNEGIRQYREGDPESLYRLIVFPEVNEIGFGYSEGRIAGSGMGEELNSLLAETLAASPALLKRGLRHIEELQLVAKGVGPDRVSDIAANVLKAFLVSYTQQQASIWKIPLVKDLPLQHYFDFETWDWSDGTFDLPQNPISGLPILLVPRRIVRLLPWINFDDYARTDFKMYLQPKSKQRDVSKTNVVTVTRNDVSLLDRYIDRKENEAARAEPAALTTNAAPTSDEIDLGKSFVRQLGSLSIGQAAASEYQRLVYEVFNYLFEPDLTDGEMEVSTYEGTERRDIVYINECERGFFKYIRGTYQTLFVLLEVKNVATVELAHVNQVAAYLGNRLGMLGFIVTRSGPGNSVIL